MVLPAKEIEYKNVWGVKTKVNVMDIKEICAEKIRAANDRIRYRDFYDLHLLFEYFKFDLEEIIELMKKKEVRKTISQKNIFNNWKLARQEKEIELGRIYYAENITDLMIENLIGKLKVSLNPAGEK